MRWANIFDSVTTEGCEIIYIFASILFFREDHKYKNY